MNKFEKLIEYHLNGETAKAKKLFHEITVETSRKIYESLRDDELSRDSDEVGDFIDEVDFDQKGLEENDEFNPDEFGDEGSDEGEFGDEGEFDDEPEGEFDDEPEGEFGDEGEFDDEPETGNDELEDRVIDLETAIDELKAEFDELMADENPEETDDEFGDDDVESDETDDEEFEFDDTEDESEDDENDENDFDIEEPESEPEDEVKESRKPRMRTSAERIREYVEKVSDGHGAEKKGAGEGHEIGKGKGFSANKQSIVAKKNDMGGTTANIAKGGSNPDPDGTTPKGKAGGFLKNAQEIDVAKRNVNKVGGSKTSTSGYTKKEQDYATNHQKDGKMVGESRRAKSKTVLNSNTRTRRAR